MPNTPIVPSQGPAPPPSSSPPSSSSSPAKSGGRPEAGGTLVGKLARVREAIARQAQQTDASGATVAVGDGGGHARPPADGAAAKARVVRARHLWGGRIPAGARAGSTLKLEASQPAPEIPLAGLRSRTFALPTQVNKSITSDYTILRQIGEGGMGVVYSASQPGLQRRVAIKTIRESSAGDPELRNRFLAEALVMGDLDHPNIVPIHELGTNGEGLLFYSMKQVRGISWDNVMPGKTRDENLEILLRIGDAIAFAHSRGVIHCDLKPENVMLGEFGEVMVMDWGLALASRPGSRAEPAGQRTVPCGTPAYMPPELALAEYDKVGPATDIYMMGAILYEIVMGAAPHFKEDVRKSIEAAAQNEFPPLPEADELSGIILRAMAAEPAGRYASVQEFQAAIRACRQHADSLALAHGAHNDLARAELSGDYQAYSGAVHGYHEALELWPDNAEAAEGLKKSRELYACRALRRGDLDLAESLLDPAVAEHQPIITAVQQARRERARRQTIRRGFKVAVVALTILTILVLFLAYRWVAAERAAAEYQAFVHSTQLAGKRLEAGDWSGVRQLRSELVGPAPGWEWEWLTTASTPHFTLLDPQGLGVRLVRKSADGRVLGLLRDDDTIECRGLGEDLRVKVSPSVKDFRLVERDGRLEVVTWNGRVVERWDAASGKPMAGPVAAGAEGDGQEGALSWDGRRLLRMGPGNAAEILHLDGSKPPVPLELPPNGRPVAGAFAPDGSTVALILRPPHLVGTWDAATGARLRVSGEHPGRDRDRLRAVQFSADGRHLLVASFDQGVGVFEAATMIPRCSLPLEATPAAFASSTAGDLVAAATAQGEISIWNLAEGRYLLQTQFPEGGISQLAFVDATLVVVDAQGRLFHLADIHHTACRILWKGELPTLRLLLDPGQGRLFFASQNRIVRSLTYTSSPAAASPPLLVDSSPRCGLGIARDADGRPCLVVGTEKGIASLDLETNTPRPWLDCGRTNNLATSPDQRWTAAALGRTLQIAGPDGATSHGRWELPIPGITELCWLADNRTLAAGSVDGSVLLVDTRDGSVVHHMRQADAILAMTVDPDGCTLATAGRDRTVHLWDTRTGGLVRALPAHNHSVLSLAFSPDGRRLFTATADGWVHIWDPATAREIMAFRAHDGATVQIVITPDGSTLITSGTDGEIRLWPSTRTPANWR